MSEWGDVPRHLRLKYQFAAFFFYLVGVSLRVLLFVIGAASVFEMRYRPVAGALGLLVTLVLLWCDSQEATEPRDWLSSRMMVEHFPNRGRYKE